MRPRPHALAALAATFRRELAAQRLNRCLHAHLALAGVAGLLPLFTPDDAAGAAPLWSLQATLYGLSLSALVLGLSAAHGESEERELLFAQPVSRGAWLGGKTVALIALVAPAALLLVVPAAFAGGISRPLAATAAAAAGLSVTLSVIGLALGLWVRDHVRGLLLTIGVWLALVFGSDLLLLGIAGSPWIEGHPSAWVAALMANPLDAFRVTVLFVIEDAAWVPDEPGRLAAWWLSHAGAWLMALFAAWTVAGFAAALAGTRRRIDA